MDLADKNWNCLLPREAASSGNKPLRAAKSHWHHSRIRKKRRKRKASLKAFQIYIWTLHLILCHTEDMISHVLKWATNTAALKHWHHTSHVWAADIATSARSFMSHFLFTFLLKPYVSCRAFKWLCWQAKQRNNNLKSPHMFNTMISLIGLSPISSVLGFVLFSSDVSPSAQRTCQ